MDRRQANQKWAASGPLSKAEIEFRVAGLTDGLGKLHHKLMIIDDSLSIFGSFNYTGPANLSNDENILIVGDLNEKSSDAKKAQKRIAKNARKEIDRIWEKFGSKI